MSRGGDHGHGVKAGLGDQGRAQRAEHGTWLHKSSEDSRRQPERLEQAVGPTFCRWIMKLRRAGIGELVGLDAGEEVMKQVGNHE